LDIGRFREFHRYHLCQRLRSDETKQKLATTFRLPAGQFWRQKG
jgi:hypothetical protein